MSWGPEVPALGRPREAAQAGVLGQPNSTMRPRLKNPSTAERFKCGPWSAAPPRVKAIRLSVRPDTDPHCWHPRNPVIGSAV